jgi:beta-lactamase regulating signal transducer with metallopeptidase domain
MTFTTFWNQGLLGLTVNHLWQSTLGVLVAWLLTQALKQNQARTRYWVWMVASVKLLVPFSVFVGWGNGCVQWPRFRSKARSLPPPW